MDFLDRIKKFAELPFISDFHKKYDKENLYLVGGMIRDITLGYESKDYDLVAENIAIEELSKFLENYGKIVSVEGRTFGVIKYKDNSFEGDIDIALPRREKYLAGQRRKHAEVEYKQVTILDDLARRDFTINAMALNLRTLKLIDPYSGESDLKNKIIKAVGDAKERFSEDPTRILRGIRFAITFDFTIEESTYDAMVLLKDEIIKTFSNGNGKQVERVSWEMIGTEFLKTFDKNPRKTIELYDKIGLLKLLFPELEKMKGLEQPYQYHTEGDVYIHTLMTLDKLPKNVPLEVKIATLFHDLGKVYTFQSVEETGDRIRFNNHDQVGAEKTKEVLRRLKLPNQTIDNVAWLIAKHMKLPYSFPKMKIDRQKNFARHPLFPELLKLVCADTMASIPSERTQSCDYMQPAEETLKVVEREKKLGLPIEIINGNKIIQILKERDSHFNPNLEGKKIGDIKKTINSMYDRGEIRNKEEAVVWVKNLARK